MEEWDEGRLGDCASVGGGGRYCYFRGSLTETLYLFTLGHLLRWEGVEPFADILVFLDWWMFFLR
jgi:hypothetical protein